MADPAMGYAPTSPLIKPPPVVVIAAPAKIVKWAASPRKTGLGPAAVSIVSAAIKAMAMISPANIFVIFCTPRVNDLRAFMVSVTFIAWDVSRC